MASPMHVAVSSRSPCSLSRVALHSPMTTTIINGVKTYRFCKFCNRLISVLFRLIPIATSYIDTGPVPHYSSDLCVMITFQARITFMN